MPEPLFRHRRSVGDVQVFESRGPWTTKSGGTLRVRCALPLEDVQFGLLGYNDAELARMPSGFDIRGLRIYEVRDLPVGAVGGTEWHRIREELVFVTSGAVVWECEDLLGAKGPLT